MQGVLRVGVNALDQNLLLLHYGCESLE
jgi:hypothetical protein